MPSPFPGMNPYLEKDTVWDDFHQQFNTRVANELTAQLRPRYIVKLEDQLYVHEKPPRRRRLLGRGDAVVKSARSSPPTPTAIAALTEVGAPVRVLLPEVRDKRKSFISRSPARYPHPASAGRARGPIGSSRDP